jgi:hypothetical protein
MKNLHKDITVTALIILAIVLFISGEYTLSTGLFAIAIIVINIKASRNRFKADKFSLKLG